MTTTPDPLDESHAETWDAETVLNLRNKELDRAHEEIDNLTRTMIGLLEAIARVETPATNKLHDLARTIRADLELQGRAK